ncbi:MAG: DeoR/GlpR transcriptional regulator, partial [Phycisphaeraceae bacterium]|nr:DeoR/GlpR transcriptional regulator [Phycisphaeraceae bacterium]
QRITFEFKFDQRHQTNLKQKKKIGQTAHQQIGERQIIFLDNGTTTLEIARALRYSTCHCTVITSSLVISSELWACAHIELVLLGGVVRQNSPDLVGSATEYMLDRLTADIAFLGSEGIDLDRGSFSESIETARICERMANNSKRVVVAADSSKLGIPGVARYATLDDIDEIITDQGAAEDIVTALRRKKITVTLV